MREIRIPKTSLRTSAIGLGCMRIADKSEKEVEALIETAFSCGINFFDHADIYGDGQSERMFGAVLKKHPEWRSMMIIQSKCDIVTPAHDGPRYDTDRDYIVSQAKKSIEQLNCSYLDLLLLHRPDPLMDPHEVAQAFDILEQEGLVRHFGVSNFPASKLSMLQHFVHQPLIVNQVQLSIVHAPMVDEDVYFNMTEDAAINRADHILDDALAHQILLQAWCPLQASWEDGSFLRNPKYKKLQELLDQLSVKYDANPSAIAAAWILRLPQNMQVLAGTTNPEHLLAIAKGSEIILDRQDWYDLYLAQHAPLP